MFDIMSKLANTELELMYLMSYAMMGMSVLIFVFLHLIKPAPYGRYGSSIWGPQLPSRLAWFLQELPAFVMPVYIYLYTPAPKMKNIANCVLLLMYLTHYLQRTFIFPLIIRGGKPTPLLTFILAVGVCSYNGYLQGCHLTHFAQYPVNWTSSPQFVIGTLMFVFGFCVNIHSDHVLRNLRKEGETGYKIPSGGMFDYVSGANFFGEMVEWCGFAIACFSLPALAFAIFTASNIGPRAVSHHRWYLKKFREEYPKNRKAFIPFIY